MSDQFNPEPWHSMMIYNENDYVVKNGVVYRARWWTTNDPEGWHGPEGSGKPWEMIGPQAKPATLPLPIDPITSTELTDTVSNTVVKATRRAIMPRVQSVVIPILRNYPALEGVKVGSWVEDIDFRVFPMLNVRRASAQAGGGRDYVYPNKMDTTVIELTAYSTDGLIECEHLYNIALEALYDAVHYQKQTDAGYLHSIKENMGMTQFSSKFMDSWRVQGLIRLGLRPATTLQ